MATMYARSVLTAWAASGGSGNWSATSGGASNGLTPGSADDVIFDANSGSARNISVDNAQCKSITMVGANAMTFTAGTTPQIVIYGGPNDMSTAVSCPNIRIAGTMSFKGGACVFSSIVDLNPYTFTLTGDLNVTGGSLALSQSGSVMNASPYNVNAGGYSFGAGVTVNMGSGTWTAAQGSWNAASATINPNTSTLKIGHLGGVATLTGPMTLYNLEIANTGGYNVSCSGGTTVTNILRMGPGSTLEIATGTTFTTAAAIADGSGITSAIKSSTTTPANLAKSGGGTLTFTKFSFSYINGSPANTIKAVNCTNVVGNTNIQFLAGNSNNLSFI